MPVSIDQRPDGPADIGRHADGTGPWSGPAEAPGAAHDTGTLSSPDHASDLRKRAGRSAATC